MSLSSFKQQLETALKEKLNSEMCIKSIDDVLKNIVELCGGIIKDDDEEISDSNNKCLPPENGRGIKEWTLKILNECDKPLSKYEVAGIMLSSGYQTRGDREKFHNNVYVVGINPLDKVDKKVIGVGGKFDKRYIGIANPNFSKFVTVDNNDSDE